MEAGGQLVGDDPAFTMEVLEVKLSSSGLASPIPYFSFHMFPFLPSLEFLEGKLIKCT